MKKGLIVFAAALFSVVTYAQNATGAYSANGTQLNSGYQGLYSGAFASFGSSVPGVPNFATKNQTIGNQFLFENWVSGSIVDNDGKVFSDGYVFNYNKMNQNLYFKIKDSAVAFIVNKSMLKSILLSDGIKTITLEKIPGFDTDNFYQVLVKGKKYSLYSLTKTNFVAANYFTNGFTSSGSMYDEFKDDVKYYLTNASGSTQEVPLKRRAVKKALEAEKAKVDAFFKTNNTAGVFSEETLKSLVESVSL